MSYEQKLLAMRKTLKKKTTVKEIKQKHVKPSSPPYEKEWLQAGLVKEENDYGIVYKRVVTYDESYVHGDIPLQLLSETVHEWKEFQHFHPLAPEKGHPLVFFDTETTGLKGTGTLIFLMGFLEQVGRKFVLTQYVLPGPDHEVAFLAASAFWKAKMNVITYNGKSFDMPQVETRWTMNRNELPPLRSHHVIDLLHGSRRLWKTELERFNLTAIEETQLNFHRQGDIPGHLAPIIYQDAVKSGRIDTLMKVLTHNEWDILSLVTLYIRTTSLLFQSTPAETAETHMNIGKWFSDLKFYEEGAAFFEQVIQKYGSNHPMTHYHYGFFLKRKDLHEKALHSFQIASKQLAGRERIIALEEVAKIQEHKEKKEQEALATSLKAIQILPQDDLLTTSFQKRMLANFSHRQKRLKNKIKARFTLKNGKRQ